MNAMGSENLSGLLSKANVQALLALLDRDGEEARIVGGAVRNALIGVDQGDVDMATTALPQEVIRRVTAAGFKAVPTGIDHGTVTVVVDHQGFEVTTLREDVVTDGRHATVAFGRSWEKDAARRDFTVNAMSLSRDGVLHDYFSGREDLKAGRIAFIGEAGQRIEEDFLRILRFFRFSAFYIRTGLDEAGFAACIAKREGLLTLSKERINAELMKLLAAPDPSPIITAMAGAGLLSLITGTVPQSATLARMVAVERALDLPPDPIRRLGSLFVLIREDAERLRVRLRLSNEAFRRLDGIGHAWRFLSPARGDNAAKAMLFAAGPRGYADRVLTGFARSGAPLDDEDWHKLISLPKHWHAPSFPVGGEDLALRGMLRGPDMGDVLARIKALWLAEGLPTDRPSIEALIIKGMAGPV
jgi:poly(A) polymerase